VNADFSVSARLRHGDTRRQKVDFPLAVVQGGSATCGRDAASVVHVSSRKRKDPLSRDIDSDPRPRRRSAQIRHEAGAEPPSGSTCGRGEIDFDGLERRITRSRGSRTISDRGYSADSKDVRFL